jgi:hypothetical protein
MTLVSVVVPVYGVRPYLPHCVESLLAQTHRDLEIILVDDGSVDGSGELCDSYAAADPRVRVVHRPNGGLSAARNSGLEVATGDHVMFVDGDDWIDPDTVESMLASADGVDVVVAGFHVDAHDGSEHLVSSVQVLPPLLYVDGDQPATHVSGELLRVIGYAWNKLYRRDVLADARFEEGVSLVEDVLFNGPLLARVERLGFIPAAHVHYVQRPRHTLRTSLRPDLGDLIARASAALRVLLESWQVPEARVDELVQVVEWGRVQWALQALAVRGDVPKATRRAQMAQVLADPYVAEVVRRGPVTGGAVRTLLTATQRRGWVRPTLLALRMRRLEER